MTHFNHSKAEKIVNESDIDDNVFKSIYTKKVLSVSMIQS